MHEYNTRNEDQPIPENNDIAFSINLGFHQVPSPRRNDALSLALSGVPVIPVVGGERDLVAVGDGVGTDVAHVARGVEWREVGALVRVLLMLRLKETNSIKPHVKLTRNGRLVQLFQLQSCVSGTIAQLSLHMSS